MNAYMHAVRACINAYIPTYLHMHVRGHTHMQTNIHTYIQIHIHTYFRRVTIVTGVGGLCHLSNWTARLVCARKGNTCIE